jgi:hypothetical protein
LVPGFSRGCGAEFSSDVMTFTSCGSHNDYFEGDRSAHQRTICGVDPKVIFDGEIEMALAQQVRLNTDKGDVRNRDATIVLGYCFLALLLLIAIYLAWGEPGTTPGQLAMMSAYP